jgi:hypothetical protein
VVTAYFGSRIPLGKRVEKSREDIARARNALKTCSVVALESLPPPGSFLSGMWENSKVGLILVAQGRLISPLPGWSLSRRNVSHGVVGGVTNANSHAGTCFRCDGVDVTSLLGSSEVRAHPRRDLRSVLKMEITGNICGKPADEAKTASHAIGRTVRL